MINYNKQDLIDFPINTYVEILDDDGEVFSIGTVVGICRVSFSNDLMFKVNCVVHCGVFDCLPKNLRRISNV